MYQTRTIPLKENIAEEKNKALRKMLQTTDNYFFLVENNCKVLDPKVYNIFIDVSQKTGIEALMWPKGEENKRLPYDDDPYIEYYTDFASAFIMVTRNVVSVVGYFDENMPVNTWQDLEYAHRIGEVGLSTPFGMFAAPKNIDQYFELTEPKEQYKNIPEMDKALKYWEEKAYEDYPIDETTKRKRTLDIKPANQML